MSKQIASRRPTTCNGQSAESIRSWICMVCVVAIGNVSSAFAEDPQDAGAVHFFSASAQEQSTSLSKELRKKRTVLRLFGDNDEERIVQCCDDLARVPTGMTLKSLNQDGSPKDTPKAAYQPCWMLAVLRTGAKAKVTYFDHQRLGHELYDSLDYRPIDRQVYHRCAPAKDGEPVFIRQHRPFDLIAIEKTRLELHFDIRTEEYRDGVFLDRNIIKLTILAAADFDGDDIEDLLVSCQHETVTKSHVVDVTLVLTRQSEGGVINPKEESFYVAKLKEWNTATVSSGKVNASE